MKIDGIVFIGKASDCFTGSVNLKGGKVNVSDFKGLIRDRKYHIMDNTIVLFRLLFT